MTSSYQHSTIKHHKSFQKRKRSFISYMKMHFRPRVTRRKNFDLVFRNLSEREGLVQSVKSTMGTNNEVKGRKGGAI